MTELEQLDFFRDQTLVADPYPYMEAMRDGLPGAARAAPERHGGDRLRRGRRGLR